MQKKILICTIESQNSRVGAMGLSVICTNIPGPMDAIEHGVIGLIVEKKDAEALKNAIICLYENRELAETLGKMGMKI